MLLIRFESRGLELSTGTVFHFQLLVDDVEVSQAHIVQNSEGLTKEITFFASKLVPSSSNHTIKILCKVSSGGSVNFNNIVDGYEHVLHGM